MRLDQANWDFMASQPEDNDETKVKTEGDQNLRSMGINNEIRLRYGKERRFPWAISESKF